MPAYIDTHLLQYCLSIQLSLRYSLETSLLTLRGYPANIGVAIRGEFSLHQQRTWQVFLNFLTLNF